MKISLSAVAALLVPLLCGAQPRGPIVSPLRPVVPATLARTAEFAFQVDGDYANPFDPDQVRVDATVTGPTGQVWQVPAFWLEPWAMGTSPSATRFAGLTYLQFFVDASLFPKGKPVSFAVSEVALVDSASGQRRAFPELAAPAAWTARTGATVTAGTTPQGEPMLVVTIVPDGQGYPGIHLVPHGDLADWSAYDTLHVRAMPLAGLKGLPLSLEVRKDQTKRSFRVFKAGGREQDWQDCVWPYDRRTPAVTWTPAGKGEWRLRLAVPTAGDYRIALPPRTESGTRLPRRRPSRSPRAPNMGSFALPRSARATCATTRASPSSASAATCWSSPTISPSTSITSTASRGSGRISSAYGWTSRASASRSGPWASTTPRRAPSSMPCSTTRTNGTRR